MVNCWNVECATCDVEAQLKRALRRASYSHILILLVIAMSTTGLLILIGTACILEQCGVHGMILLVMCRAAAAVAAVHMSFTLYVRIIMLLITMGIISSVAPCVEVNIPSIHLLVMGGAAAEAAALYWCFKPGDRGEIAALEERHFSLQCSNHFPSSGFLIVFGGSGLTGFSL